MASSSVRIPVLEPGKKGQKHVTLTNRDEIKKAYDHLKSGKTFKNCQEVLSFVGRGVSFPMPSGSFARV